MAVKFKPNEIILDRATKVKTKKVFPIAGVKASELLELCAKPESDLRRGERKTRAKARVELAKRGIDFSRSVV